MRLTIRQQGDVHIEHADILHEGPDVIALEVGTREKYPEAGGSVSGEEFSLMPHDRGEASTQTIACFDPPLEGRWRQVMDTDRYHVTVVLVREPERDERVRIEVAGQ